MEGCEKMLKGVRNALDPPACGAPYRNLGLLGVTVFALFRNLKFTGLTHNFPVDPEV
jgi:hypothetical protein